LQEVVLLLPATVEMPATAMPTAAAVRTTQSMVTAPSSDRLKRRCIADDPWLNARSLQFHSKGAKLRLALDFCATRGIGKTVELVVSARMPSLFSGFALGLSLILAIGAQNAFVLRQGLRQSHVFAVCLTCALSDAILVAAGVAGFGWLVEAAPWIAPVFTLGGAAFLVAYGAISLRSAWRGGHALEAADARADDLRRAVLTCLALT